MFCAFLTTLILVCCATPCLAQTENQVQFEAGVDVLANPRSGELALYAGAFQRDHMIAVRFGARDETDTVPCSIGIMYDWTGHRRGTGPIHPTVGGSLSRVFTCTSDANRYPAPSPQHGAAIANGGIVIDIFRGPSVSGSMKIQGYVERARGHVRAADTFSRGVAIGVVIRGV